MFASLSREPVRAYIYSVTVAVLGALVVFGVIDAETQDILSTIAGAVLVVAATETARAKVTPTVSETDPVGPDPRNEF